MKTKTYTTLAAAAILGLAANANAALVAGWYEFPVAGPHEADVTAPGFMGTATGSATTSTTFFPRGSDTGTYGTSGISSSNTDDGDGYLAGTLGGSWMFAVTNNSGLPSKALDSIYFDAATRYQGPPGQFDDANISSISLAWDVFGSNPQSGGINDIQLTEFYRLNPGGNLRGGNFGEFGFELPSIILLDGDSINFTFTQTVGAYGFALDNIGLTVVPEPTNVLALALLLSSGVMFRNRRRKA